MNHLSRYIACSVFIVFISIITIGCNENSVINARILPNLDTAVGTPVSLDVYATTVFDTDVNTGLNNGLPIYHALGAFNDPTFGKTNAGIYFQVIPSVIGTNPLVNTIIDSAVLIIPYGGYTYGNTSDLSLTQNYTVYRVNSASFPVNTPYYPDQPLSVDMALPLSASTPFALNKTFNVLDSIQVNGINEPPHLRIPLNNTFIQLISNSSNSSYFSDFNTFLGWFNGIYVQATDTTKTTTALPYFRLDGIDAYSQANVQIYYHNSATDTAAQIISYYFTATTCGHGNKISRVYPGSFNTAYFSSPYQINNTVALQGPPGAAIDLLIPLQKNKIPLLPTSIINKAELSISCNSFDSLCPPNLTITGIDKNNIFYTIEDFYPIYSTSSLAVFDGTPHPTANGTSYICNIPRELLNAVKSNKDTLHLRLNGYNGSFNYPGAYRMTGSNIKLNIVYSTLK